MSVPVVTPSFSVYQISAEGVFSDQDGASTIVERFIVKKNTPSPITTGDFVVWVDADFAQLVLEGVIPAVGVDRATYIPTLICDFPQDTMRCRDVQFVTQKTGEVLIEVTWSTLYSARGSTLGSTALYNVLPASMEYAGGTRTMKAWRQEWAEVPPETADTSLEIGGLPFFGKTNGVDILVPQVKIRLRFTLDATVTPMISQYAAVVAYLGKINTDVFLDFPAGSIICEGITMGKVQHEYYELIIELLYDAYNHHDQVPEVDPDDGVVLDGNGEAESVYWQRIKRDGAPFNNLWNGDPILQEQVETGYLV
jgi:hypothetical protein